MIIRKWYKGAETITITVTVASVAGHTPLVGFSEEVEKAWRSLLRKHNLKERNSKKLCKVASTDGLELDEPIKEETLVRSNTASDIGKVMLKFQQLERDEIERKKDDVYSKTYVPKKYSKMSADYGTPKPGTLTEKRAQKASKHIGREMLYLCEMIQEYGYISKRDGTTNISFGKLFQVYQFISDKVVGMLLRARKHNMVSFEGEMLFQRRDEQVVITLLLSPEQIKYAIESN